MTNAERKAAAQRKARDAAERATRKDLVSAYGDAWRRIRTRLDAIAADMAEARKAGRTIRPSWLYEERRLEKLAQGIEAEFGTFIDLSTRRITDDQMQAAITGRDDAADLIRASLPESARFTPAFPTVPFEEMVGRLSSGATLGEHLGSIVPQTAIEGVKAALLQGIALGQNPRKVARAMRDAGGLPLARALTIARTETLGVYREATRQTYAANSDVLTGWEWHSALDKRTCPVCWSMHGTMHKPDETLDTHPSCRCSQIPVPKPWSQLGFEGVPETRVTLEKGEDIFARQSEALQRAVLGPGKFAAYKSGQMSLRDTVMKTRSAKWGPGRRERSLRDIGTRRAGGKATEQQWSCGSPCRIAEFRPMTDAERKALAVPPAWTDVRMAKDPKSPLQIVGRDTKGRSQYRYSAEHTAKQSALKFDRVTRFGKELDAKILPAIRRDLAGGPNHEEALVLRLIHRTGFRVGSTADTGAKVQAYGATTLRAEHLTIKGDALHFRFVGKKGVTIEHTIEDAELARLLAPRVARGGNLFSTSDAKVRDYLHANNGAHKVKDFRTWVGTNTALDAIKRLPTPKTLTEFKRLRTEVGKVVSSKLGNTPTVALESYIDPRVFEIWGAF